VDKKFEPVMSAEKREEMYRGWKKAIEKAKGWID
jgi:glycerol kinase